MADNGLVNQLKSMLMSFRVAELQMLLGYAGKPKSGKKNELQSQALELLKGRSLTIGVQNKIKELHRQRFTASAYGTGINLDSAVDTDHCGVTTRSGAGHGVSSSQSSSSSSSALSQSSGGHLLNGSNQIPQIMAHQNSYTKPQHLPSQFTRTATDYYTSMPRSLGSLGMDFSQKQQQSPQYQTSNTIQQLQYPLYPDVRFKPLPFYDISSELLKPSSLIPTAQSRFQESTFTFHLTPQQANDIAMSRDVQPGAKVDYGIQVQLRFCLLETSCEQEDNFPPSICVKVNSKMCPLPNPLPTNKPGVEPKRPSRPVNITTLVKVSPTVANQISISWASDYGRPYAVGVFLVKKLTPHVLLSRIKSNGIRNADHTRAMIKEKLQHDPDSEIATTSLRGSLLCPLGKMRIQLPCRATTCSHVQCFDALLYLQMNEKKPSWICPVCDKPAIFSNLAIDGLFTEIINDAPCSCTEVQFYEDGSWTSVATKKESFETLSPGTRKSKKRADSPDAEPPKRQKIEIITIDSESDDDSDTNKDTASVIPSTPVLSSGSGSESETPSHQSLPSPDSSSSASVNAIQPLSSHIDNPPAPFYPSSTIGSTSYTRSGSTNATNSPLSFVRSGSTSSVGPAFTAPYPMSSPLLNPNNQPFYPNYMTDYINNPNTFFNYNSSFDITSALDQLFRQGDSQEREIPNYMTASSSSSSSTRRQTDYDHDIISID